MLPLSTIHRVRPFLAVRLQLFAKSRAESHAQCPTVVKHPLIGMKDSVDIMYVHGCPACLSILRPRGGACHLGRCASPWFLFLAENDRDAAQCANSYWLHTRRHPISPHAFHLPRTIRLCSHLRPRPDRSSAIATQNSTSFPRAPPTPVAPPSLTPSLFKLIYSPALFKIFKPLL